jgi:hypothetical protein
MCSQVNFLLKYNFKKSRRTLSPDPEAWWTSNHPMQEKQKEQKIESKQRYYDVFFSMVTLESADNNETSNIWIFSLDYI